MKESILQSERLSFEAYSKDQFPFLKEIFCRNQKVMSSTLSGKTLSQKDLGVLIEEKFNHSLASIYGFVVVREKISNKYIGVSGLFICDYLNKKDIEFGFILDDQYWGKGYATEIGRFWIDFVLNELDLTRIIATTNPNNNASNAVLKKLGMKSHSKVEIDQRGERIIYLLEK